MAVCKQLDLCGVKASNCQGCRIRPLPALHPGLGKCIRPWKARRKRSKTDLQTRHRLPLGRRHALVGPSSARVTARHKLRFQRGLLCICRIWMDLASLVFHLRTFKPSKPDDKMLGLRAQAAHSTQLRSKCPVPPLESSLYIANGAIGGN